MSLCTKLFAPSEASYKQLLLETCERWGVPYALALSDTHEKPAAFVRASVFSVLRSKGASLQAIGAAADGRDHATIHHALARLDALETWMVAWRNGDIGHKPSAKRARAEKQKAKKRAVLMQAPPRHVEPLKYAPMVSREQMTGGRA